MDKPTDYRIKLSDEDVAAIRQLKTHGLSNKEMAEHYNVSKATISLILSGKRRNCKPVNQ